MKKYYIYVFLDESKPGEFIYDDIKLDYEPFYVGEGTGSRITTSILDRESPFKVNKINKIKKSGGNIISIKLYENLENEESLEVEKVVISKIGRRDLGLGTLVNQTDGGDGRLSSPHSDETKKKISIINTENARLRKELGTDKHTDVMIDHLRVINTGDKNPMWGKTHTDEVKEAQSLNVSGVNHPMFGKSHSKETIYKIRKNRNKSVNQDELNKMHSKLKSKSILQYDLSGNFIDEYESIKIAALFTKCSESIIGKSCRGVIKSPRRFVFKFKDECSKVLTNSYLYKIGDCFILNNIEYILIKRNKMSCIVSENNNMVSLRKKDCLFIWEKKLVN